MEDLVGRDELGVAPPPRFQEHPALHVGPSRVVDGEAWAPYAEELLALAVANAVEFEIDRAPEHDRAELDDHETGLFRKLAPGRGLHRLTLVETAARGEPPGPRLRPRRIAPAEQQERAVVVDDQHPPGLSVRDTRGRRVVGHAGILARGGGARLAAHERHRTRPDSAARTPRTTALSPGRSAQRSGAHPASGGHHPGRRRARGPDDRRTGGERAAPAAAPPGLPLVVPQWNGNEFLLPDGHRPAIRTFTPRRVDADALELDIEVVLHGEGVASRWAEAAAPGREVAVSGPGRGYTIDPAAPAFLLAGDESAIPAISQLLEVVPHVPTQVRIEVSRPDARVDLPAHPHAGVTWHDLPTGEPTGTAFAAAVRAADLPEGVRVWVAGEAAAVQRVRQYLFDERGLPRAQATVRGYWKHGRAGDDEA